MFRKSLLALSALTVIGAAALVPTAASAGWKGGWKHFGGYYGGWGYGYSDPYYASSGGYYGGCWVKKWIDTPFGPRLKRIYVCY